MHVRDQDTSRGTVAREAGSEGGSEAGSEAGTTLLAADAEPGAVYTPSEWDTEPLPG